MDLEPLGDSAVVATLGTTPDEATLRAVRNFAQALVASGAPEILDVVAAYASVTVFYDAAAVGRGADSYEQVCERIRSLEPTQAGAPQPDPPTVEIPVLYGGPFGPDLDAVAAHAGLTPAEAATLHMGGHYLVCATGFAPGFAYLGGLSPALHTPRHKTPRLRVEAGSVGIGGSQTGVYPLVSPGGWQIIGRTPLALFQAGRSPASLLRTGDRVRFRAISREEFEAWK